MRAAPTDAAAGLNLRGPGWSPALVGCVLFLGCAAVPSARAESPARSAGAGSPAIHWRVHSRDLSTLGWRQGVTVGGQGELWVGGVSDPASPGGKLLRKKRNEPWREQGEPLRGSRAYVLDADPDGAVWAATYTPLDAQTYVDLTVYRTDGDAWRMHRVVPGIWPQAMQAFADDEVWIAGNRGLLLHHQSGRWRRVQLTDRSGQPVDDDLLGLRMATPREGWVVGSRGLVARYQLDRWVTISAPDWLQGQQLKGVDITRDGAVWLVGTSGMIARRTPEGWVRFPSPVTSDLTAIAMTSPNAGWAVGFEGVILRFDGARWHSAPSPTNADLNAIEMVGPARGWIAGAGVLLEAASVVPGFGEVSELPFYRALKQPAHAVSAVDLDGDGRVEIALLNGTEIEVFGNPRGEGFEPLWAIASPRQAAGAALISAAWGDLAGDGRPDLLVLQEGEGDVLFFDNPRGHSHRGRALRPTELEGPTPGWRSIGDTAYFLDVDLDGRLDLYLSRSLVPGPASAGNLLFLQGADGTLRQAGPQDSGRGIENVALWGDFNGDQALDVFLPGFNQQELTLLLNDGAGQLLEATAEAGLDLQGEEGIIRQAAVADLDNDGDLDLLFLQERLHFFLNDGAARFRADEALRSLLKSNPAEDHGGLLAVADVDHDGSLDILFQPDESGHVALRLLSRGPDGHFRDVTQRSGLADLRGQSAVFVDLDGDGDLDLFVAAGSGSRIFENQQDDRAFLEVRLRGSPGNRLAVGAVVAVYEQAAPETLGRIVASRQVGLGRNPAGFSGLTEVHFGLPGDGPYGVEARFPGGQRIVRHGIAPGTRLVIDERPALADTALRTRHRLQRAWHDGTLLREALGLAGMVLLLTLWTRVAPRRLQAWRLASRKEAMPILLLLWAAAAVSSAMGWLPAIGVGLRLGLAALVLVFLTVWDRGVSQRFSKRQIGPYRIETRIGSGAMGEVYRARHVVAGGRVAVKVVHGLPGGSVGEQGVERLRREAAILRKLDHAAIVRILDSGSSGRRFWLAMELLEGESLAARLARDGPLSIPLCARLLKVLAEALHHAHGHGILHRDLSSTNVFLTRSEQTRAEPGIRLMDFGLAHADEAAPLTQRSVLVGTLAYMAPELFEGGTPEPRTDLYALGALTYEALTGRLIAFRSSEALLSHPRLTGTVVPPSALRDGVPELLDRAVQRLLAPAAEDRFPSAAVLVAAMEQWGEQDLDRSNEPRSRPAMPKPTSPSVSGDDSGDRADAEVEPWRELFARARQERGQGRIVRAEALMVDCLDALMTQIGDDPAGSSHEHDVEEVLAFMARLRAPEAR